MHNILNYGFHEDNKQQETIGQTHFLLELLGDLRIFIVQIRMKSNNNYEEKISDGNENENDPFFRKEIHIEETEMDFTVKFQYQLLFPDQPHVTKGIREDPIISGYLMELQKRNPQIYLYISNDMIMAIFLYRLCPRRVIDNMSTDNINQLIQEIQILLNTREQQLKQIHQQILLKHELCWENLQQDLKKKWDDISDTENYEVQNAKQIAKARLIDITAYNQQENRISFCLRGSEGSLYRCTYESDELYNIVDEQQLKKKYAAILVLQDVHNNGFENGFVKEIMRIRENFKFSFITKLYFLRSVCEILNSIDKEYENIFGEQLHVDSIWTFQRKVQGLDQYQLNPVFVLFEKSISKPKSLIQLLKNLIVESIFDNEMKLNLKIMDNLFGDYMRLLAQIDEKFFPKFSSIVKRIDCIKEIISEIYLLSY